MTGAARAQPPNQRMQLSGALSSGLRPVLPAAHFRPQQMRSFVRPHRRH